MHMTLDRAERLLCDLIAIPTVNPMGQGYRGNMPVERPVVEYLERLFAPYGVEMRRVPCGPIHESLLITIPGRSQTPGTLIESHIDTVPADDWLDRAFEPRVEEGRVFGRGACDDKGSLAAMCMAALELLETGQSPPQPVWLLAAGDEEYTQSGIREFLTIVKVPIGRAVFGEPTDLSPVVQHKGIVRWDITANGRSAHTSRAELGQSAILDIFQVISTLSAYERELRARHTSRFISGPSLVVTAVEGGRARNMVPDQCKIAVDFRVAPGMDGKRAFEELRSRLNSLHLSLEHSDFQCFAPALNTDPNHEFVAGVAEICQGELGRVVAPSSAPYGSDAGWAPRGIPTIVLGPGSIAQAHAVDEYVELKQVAQAAAIYRRIVSKVWSHDHSVHRESETRFKPAPVVDADG